MVAAISLRVYVTTSCQGFIWAKLWIKFNKVVVYQLDHASIGWKRKPFSGKKLKVAHVESIRDSQNRI